MLRGSTSLRLLRPLLQPIVVRSFSVTPVLHARKKETAESKETKVTEKKETKPRTTKAKKAKEDGKQDTTEPKKKQTTKSKVKETKEIEQQKEIQKEITEEEIIERDIREKQTREREAKEQEAKAAKEKEKERTKIETKKTKEEKEIQRMREIERQAIVSEKVKKLREEFNTFASLQETIEKEKEKDREYHSPVTIDEIAFKIHGPPTYNLQEKHGLQNLEQKFQYKKIFEHKDESVLSVLSNISKKFDKQVQDYENYKKDKKVATKSIGHIYRFPPKKYLQSSAEAETVGHDKPRNWPLLRFQGYSEELIGDRHKTPVPKLHHNLTKVLFSPGVHPLRDLSTKQFNFPTFLEKIDQPENIDFNAIPPFVTSSQDKDLQRLAEKHGARFTGSTSSVSPLLSQLFFLISDNPAPVLDSLTAEMQRMPHKFTKMSRKPACAFLRKKHNDIFSVDSDPGSRIPDNQILMDLGKSMERWLTMPKDEFNAKMVKTHKKYKKAQKNKTAKDIDKKEERESYVFNKIGPFMFRSQQDCEHLDIAGDKKVFDLKSRAIYEVRKDCLNYENASKFRLDFLIGPNHSFEREFYDMVRASFIKNYFQVRIGHMSGLFITYHNTQEVFGFEYISREDIENVLFGSQVWGQKVYETTVQLLGEVLNLITDRHNTNCRIVFRTHSNAKNMDIFVEEVGESDKGWKEPIELAQEHYERTKNEGEQKNTFITEDTKEGEDKREQAMAEMNIEPSSVFWYQLSVLKFVNGGNGKYNPGDNLEVFYNVFDNTENKAKLSSYLEVLSGARIYKEFD